MTEEGEGTAGGAGGGHHEEENVNQGLTCFRREVLVILGVTLSCAILGAGIGIGFAIGKKDSSSSERSNSLNSSNETQGQLTTGPTPSPSDLSRPSGAPIAAAIVSPTLRPTISLSQSDTPSVTPTVVITSTPPTHLPTFGLSTSNPSTAVIPTAVPSEKDQLNFEGEDPFSGIDPFEIPAWRNQGSGLSLQILNALDDIWQNTFDVVVQEWDNGIPDALSLTVSQIPVEPECRVEFGMVKVCNGNYGASQWRGISTVLLDNDAIVASAVRLNEFYLSGADDAERQYTLCHELGHSFGLPHTDENFFNADLGNCLDYTNIPAANKSPGAINFERLATVYGTIETSPAPTLEDTTGINSRLLRTKASMKRLDREFVLGSSSNYETRHLRTGGFELRTYRLPP